MTMKIVITNDDPHRTAVVTEEEFDISTTYPQSARQTKFDIPPKGAHEVWIHAAKLVTITENPNASQPKPAE